jgi:hypothetical protein
LLDDFQRRLLAAPVAGLFGLVDGGLGLALGLLTLVTEEEFVATRELLFELSELKLKLQLLGFAMLELKELPLQLEHELAQGLDFGIQELRRAAKRLDIFYVVQGHGEKTYPP